MFSNNRVIVLLVLLVLVAGRHSFAFPETFDPVQARASNLHLHESATWHKLLHYVPRLLGSGVKSLVDDSRFFLDPQGPSNPEAEFAATLHRLFGPNRKTADQCRFLARYLWIRRSLSLQAQFAEPVCPEFSEWIGEINPVRAVLVFPAAYLNNPSSMYGHTLLRLDSPKTPSGSNLYAYAINFAARTEESNGFLFAVKGLTGLYSGEFSVLPYFRKVTEYSNLESRDIWEYPLDLTVTEIRFMLAHLWELRDIRFDYYFLDENCSYQLLALIEVARDELDLTTPFLSHAIPGDTLKIALAQAGQDGAAVVYRPSLASRIRQRQSRLDRRELDWVDDLSRGRIMPNAAPLMDLPPERRALVLETAYDYALYHQYRERLPARTTAPIALRILRERSRLESAAEAVDAKTPSSAPHLGHPSRRLDLGVGHDWTGDYLRLQYKPAYHDLLDPQRGYPRGAQINTMRVELRIDDAGVRLDSLELIDIVSLVPRERLFPLASWRINLALRRLPLAPTGSPLGLAAEGGYGISFGREQWLQFSMIEGVLYVQEDLENHSLPGLGLRVGLLYYPDEDWALQASWTGRQFYGELDRIDQRLALEQRFGIADAQSIRFDVALERRDRALDNFVQLSWQYHF